MSTQDHVSRALEQWNFATANVLSCSFNREQPGMSIKELVSALNMLF